MSKQEVNQRTVDKLAEQLKKNSNLSSEAARKIAVDAARKENQQRKDK